MRRSRGWWLLALIGGCTSHADEQPPVREREPDVPPPVVIETKRLMTSEEVTRGPVTPLSLKPFTGALGDVNGDGQPDVVALCHGTDMAVLLVLEGRFDGSFRERARLDVQASGVALGDLDGDADLDAFLTDARGKPAYRVALNDGDGDFSVGEPREIFGRYGGELRGTTLHDLDGNGTLDAVVPLWDSIRTLPGTGHGSFGTGRPIPVGRDPFDTAVADLDRDGRPDLVATTGAARSHDRGSYDSSGASVWIARGFAGGFAEPTRIGIPGAKQVEIGDLDRDGLLEIVTSGSSGLTIIRDPLGDPQLETLEVATDGPLVLAELLEPSHRVGLGGPEEAKPPGLDLITSSFVQSRIHVLTDPNWQTTSLHAGSYVLGLYATDFARDGGRMDMVVLNAGPPGAGVASSIELLFGSD